MATLVDTCILLRAFDAHFLECRLIRQALRKALSEGDKLLVTVQNMAEFWNVMTRPLTNNGQGLSPGQAKRRLAIVERLCEVVSEDRTSYSHWKRLVDELTVTGVAVHDARLVAVMLSLGVTRVLTLNDRDFRRYEQEGIGATTPQFYVAS